MTNLLHEFVVLVTPVDPMNVTREEFESGRKICTYCGGDETSPKIGTLCWVRVERRFDELESRLKALVAKT